MSVNKLLIRDNKLTINNGKIIFVEDGIEASCNCCGPGCPDKKVCADSQGDLQYPVPVNDFYVEVSGIPDTMSAEAVCISENESWTTQGVPFVQGCFPCDSHIKINGAWSYTLSGFSALNRKYQISQTIGSQCDDVCNPCTYIIESIVVPIYGTQNRTFTSSVKTCIEESGGTTVNDFILCGTAYIRIFLTNGNLQAGIVITGAVDGSGLGRLSPSRSYEYTYLNIQKICSPPNIPEGSFACYIGDFSYFGWRTGSNFCPEQEYIGGTLITSSSFQCQQSALDINLPQNGFWNSCSFSYENEQVGTRFNNPNCNFRRYAYSSFTRRGLDGYNIRLVRA